MQYQPDNGYDVAPGDHLCFLYQTEDEHRAVLTNFLRYGLAQKNKIIYAMDTSTSDKILGYLSAEDVNADRALENGQLIFLSAQQFFLQGGEFDADAMIESLQQETQRALEEGYSALRVTGEMSWVLGNVPGAERLFEYEAKLNDFFSKNSAIGLCQYDRQQFQPVQPETLQDILRTHPLAVIGKKSYQNSYYIPPSQLLGESPVEAELETWIGNLAENEQTVQELRAEKRMFKEFFDAVPDICSFQLPDHTVVRYNSVGLNTLNLTQEQAVGRKCYEIIGRDRECEPCATRRAQETKRAEIMEKYIPELGGYIEQRSVPVFAENGEIEYIVELLRDVTERKRTEQAVEYRLEFEERICTASNRFINCAPEAFDQRVNETLASIGEFVDAARAYFFQFHGDLRLMSNTHEWCAEGVSPQIDNLQNVAADSVPWWTAKLKNCETIHLRHLEELPPEAENERRILESQNITSLIVVPLVFENGVLGFIGFDAVREETAWSQDTVSLLQTTGEILANALQRHRFQQELEKSRRRYQGLLESQTELVIRVDSQYRFTYVNEAFCRTFGRSREELFGTTFTHFVHEDDVEDTLEAIKNLEKPPHHISVHQRAKTVGGWLWLEWDNNAILNDSGEIVEIQGVGRDITSRKRAEEALRQSEANYRKFFETIQDMIVVGDTNGDIMDGNSALMQRLGYSLEELRQMHVLDLHPEEVRAEAEDVFSEIINGERSTCPLPLASKDGTNIPVETRVWFGKWNGMDCVLSISKDLTREKEAEERFERLFRNNPALMALIALPERDCVDVNDTFVKTLGYSKQEILGRPLSETALFSNMENPKAIADQVEREGWITDFELQVVKKDGSPIDGLLSGELIVNQGRQYILWVMIDVTERNRVKAELEKTNAELKEKQQQLVHQERQRALSTMASGIAHDFNNALLPIQEFSEMLTNNPDMLDNREKALEYIDRIQKSANRASETIRRMRKFYQPEEVARFTELDLNSVITDAVLITEPRWKEETKAAGREIEVQTELGDLPAVLGNEAELNDVMTNLIFNAVDAMPEGGHIAVATYMQRGRVVLEFSDNGIGMSAETRRKCLDPFYTEKGADGSGLGLATVQGIIHRHNGELSIDSKEGEGTTFYIMLPVAESTGEPAAYTEKQPCDSLQILAVEDEEAHREVLHNILSAEGHQVETASNGVEGLEKFNTGWFDLVIIDRAMPEMRGDDLADKVKEAAPEKPVIMFTGFGDMMDAAGEKPPNVDTVLSKRFTREKLQEAIRELIVR